MALDMDQIQGLVAALAAKRSLATKVPIADVDGLTELLAGITPNLSRAAIQGLYISNAVGFATTRVTISEGQCRDSTNTVDIVLPSGLTKALNAPWAVGNGNGGRINPAAVAANSWYHLFVALNPTTGVVDAFYDQAPLTPVLPAGFTKWRRIGAVLTDASGNVWLFKQKPDRTIFKNPRGTEFAGLTGQSTSGTLRQFHLPRGIKVKPIIIMQSTSSNGGWCGLYDPDDGPPPTFGVPTQWGQIRRYIAGEYIVEMANDVWTDTNAMMYSAGSDSGDTMAFGSLAWFDPLEWGY